MKYKSYPCLQSPDHKKIVMWSVDPPVSARGSALWSLRAPIWPPRATITFCEDSYQNWSLNTPLADRKININTRAYRGLCIQHQQSLCVTFQGKYFYQRKLNKKNILRCKFYLKNFQTQISPR